MSHQLKNHEDFQTMGKGLINLKFVSGMAQMGFALVAFLVNKYFIEEIIVQYASFAMFGFGFFLVGIRYQTVISPSRRLVRVTRGFFFFVITNEYGTGDIAKVLVTKKMRRGTDSNGIGPTKEDAIMISYCVQLELKNSRTINITSSSEKQSMNDFAERVANALNSRFEPILT